MSLVVQTFQTNQEKKSEITNRSTTNLCTEIKTKCQQQGGNDFN